MSPPAPSLLLSQPSDETEEDMLENLMEDSGHGLDIGSEESRFLSTSDEEESMEVDILRASRGVERRRPRRSRVAYKVWSNYGISLLFFIRQNFYLAESPPSLQTLIIKLSTTLTYCIHTIALTFMCCMNYARSLNNLTTTFLWPSHRTANTYVTSSLRWESGAEKSE